MSTSTEAATITLEGLEGPVTCTVDELRRATSIALEGAAYAACAQLGITRDEAVAVVKTVSDDCSIAWATVVSPDGDSMRCGGYVGSCVVH